VSKQRRVWVFFTGNPFFLTIHIFKTIAFLKIRHINWKLSFKQLFCNTVDCRVLSYFSNSERDYSSCC